MNQDQTILHFFYKLLCTSALFLFCFFFANAKNISFNVIFNDTSVAASNAKSYLALGDSYTIGQSVDSAQRFPAQTAAILKHKGYNISSIDYIATTGWKTVNLQWAIEDLRTIKTYDVVTLLIGVNDQYLKRDTTDYRAHFTNLLQKAIRFARNNSKHVFVLSLPDYGVTPFGAEIKGLKISRQIDEFNAINKSVAQLYEVNYTDVTGISRYDAIDSTTIAWDDLHPSGKQYAQWASALANKMWNVLE